jgi:hypothetical protein
MGSTATIVSPSRSSLIACTIVYFELFREDALKNISLAGSLQENLFHFSKCFIKNLLLLSTAVGYSFHVSLHLCAQIWFVQLDTNSSISFDQTSTQ